MGRYMIEWTTRLRDGENADDVGESVSDAFDFGGGHGLANDDERKLCSWWAFVEEVDDVDAFLRRIAAMLGRPMRFEVTCLDGLKPEVREFGG